MTDTPVDVRVLTAVRKVARQSPQWTALVYEGQSISYSELADSAGRLASLLAESGVSRGDRVAYLGLNSPAFIQTFLASSWLGAVFVPVNFRLTSAEVEQVLADSGTHSLVAEPGHQGIIDAVAERAGIRHCLLVDDDPAVPVTGEAAARWTMLSLALAGRTTHGEPVPSSPDELAALMYTSGTTGRAKGVKLSHGNLWWNGVDLDWVVAGRSGDIDLAINPLFHVAPLSCFTLRALTRGGTTVLRRSFDAAQVLTDLVELRVNTLFAVPAAFAAIAREPGFATADLTTLHSVVTAGAPAEPKLIAQYADRGVVIQQGWGLTEVLFGSMLPAAQTREKIGSVGVPMAHTELRIMGQATGRELPEPGEPGEVWVRGPNVSSGYWNNPEATAAAFTSDGWFRTGDIGRLDGDGCLFIVDRLKDMVIVGGENVYPAEVQRVLGEYPGVAETAVVGMPDPASGERVVALVTCEANAAAPCLPELREFAAAQLAEYKLPTRLHVVDELPRNVMGKIDKVTIRAALAAGELEAFRVTERTLLPTGPTAESPGRTQEPTVPSPELGAPDEGLRSRWAQRLAGLSDAQRYEALLGLVRSHVVEMLELSGAAAVGPEQKLTDLGLGSLSAVQLCDRLGEATGLRLPSTLLFDYPTCAVLARHLRESLLPASRPESMPTLLTRLDEVAAALEDATLDGPAKTRIASRLRDLLAGLGPAFDASVGEGASATAEQVAVASDDELFDLIDGHLGGA